MFKKLWAWLRPTNRRLKKLESAVEALQLDLEDLESELESQISDHQREIHQLEMDKDNLEDRILELERSVES